MDGDSRAAVRGAFYCSYERLTLDGRRLFRLLGLMPGPELGVPAAAVLAGIPPDQAGRLLDGLVALAVTYQRQGDPDTAIDHTTQALAIACQAGFPVLEGNARAVLADAHLALGRQDLAVEQARQAVAVHQRTGHILADARSLVTLGRVLAGTDGSATAAACWREALTLLIEIGSPDAGGVRALLDTHRGAARSGGYQASNPHGRG